MTKNFEKDGVKISDITEMAKSMKLCQVGYWISKALRVELSIQHGICVLIYMRMTCKDNMDRYLIQAEQIFEKLVGKKIIVKTLCSTGIRDKTCRK